MGSENKICFLFHSTHPRRVWRIVLVSLILVQTVSIHTPTKGVTLEIKLWQPLPEFQSTHPRRVWHRLHGDSFKDASFNPHTHEGCDWNLCQGYQESAVSIHTPTKGVTFPRSESSRVKLFQSTHPRRVWLFLKTQFKRKWSFNPHTHEGCDQLAKWKLPRGRVSIHTPTKGVTS